ncbi:MAG TPA: hypothetical protein VKF59_17020 [Candidatus Dormibacteraeota bacterium]|nr:hypothetical protein [Candidatus Dormibacteraeota bacterium]
MSRSLATEPMLRDRGSGSSELRAGAGLAGVPVPSTWADVRLPYALPACIGLAAAAAALVLYLTRRFGFFFDEWTLILFLPHFTVRDYFLPHNEHWSTIPYLIYRGWFALVGVRTVLPYMATLLTLHVMVGLELFVLIRRRAGDLLALVAAALMLFLGQGFEDMIWPFQVAFVGAVAFGLLALLLLDRPDARWTRLALASAVLVVSLMFSGVSLFFCAAVAVELALDPRRRRYLAVLVAPAVVYGAWYAVFGGQGATSHRNPYTLSALLSLADYVPFGIGAAAAGLVALPVIWGQAALGVLAGIVGLRLGQLGRLEPRVAGAGVGLLAQFGLTGLVRAEFGASQAASSRYVYIGVVFLLLGLTPLVRGLRWRRTWWPPLAAVLAVILVADCLALRDMVHYRNGQFDVQTAELRTVLAFQHAPGIQQDAAIDNDLVPGATVRLYLETRDRLGSTVADATVADLSGLNAQGVNQAVRDVMPLSFAAATRAPAGLPCMTLEPAQRFTDLTVGSSGRLWVTSSVDGSFGVGLSLLGPAPAQPGLEVPVSAGVPVLVTLPDAGQPVSFRVRVQPPANSRATVCGDWQ